MAGLLFIALGGCMDQAAFERRYAESRCELFADCEAMDTQGFATHQECEDGSTPIAGDCLNFDSKAARTCVAAITAMDCSALLVDIQPEACGRVCTE